MDIRTPRHELRRGIGHVIQQAGLFPHRKVADNIATVPQLAGWPKDRVRERVTELAELVELDPDLLDRYPSALSEASSSGWAWPRRWRPTRPSC